VQSAQGQGSVFSLRVPVRLVPRPDRPRLVSAAEVPGGTRIRPDAIVLDVMLQDGDDGWQVLERLKSDPATRDIPVVIHSVIDNPERARKLGAEGVLPKSQPRPG